jgi:hypothetical protein
MNRHFLVLGALSLSTIAGSLACSGAPTSAPFTQETPPGAAQPTASNPVNDDAGTLTPTDATTPAPAPTTSPDDDAAAPSPSGATDADAPLPTAIGTLLAAGAQIALAGITDDGFVAYSSGDAVLAAPLAGGASIAVKSGRSIPSAKVSGAAIFAWVPPVPPELGVDLDVWTNAHGVARLAEGSVAGRPVAASADGTRVAFFAGSELTVDALDSATSTQIGRLCATQLSFDGKGDLVTANCPAAMDDGGALSPSVSVFVAPSFARSLLAADATSVIDPTGTWIWVVGDDAGGKLLRAADASVAFSDVLVSGPAFFDAQGKTLYYAAGGALRSVSLSDPSSATTIVKSGVTEILALAPDAQNLVYRGGDDVLVQSTAAGAPAAQWLETWVNPSQRYTFTSDSADIVSVVDTSSGSVYAVRAIGVRPPVATGFAASVTMLAGSKILAVDASNRGHVIDASGNGAAVDVPGMAAFAVTKDLTRVAYVATSVTVPGLYVVSVGGAAPGEGGAP